MWRVALLLFIACSVVACGSDKPTITGVAHLKDARGIDVGKVTFTQLEGEPVTISVAIATTSTVVVMGEHGMHIHAGKSCGAPPFMSAMGHWNPTMQMHGDPGNAAGMHHFGDLGNITIGADRTGSKEMTSAELTLLPEPMKSIAGLTVIFHGNRDDLVTQNPPGNSGPRLACGVIGGQ